MLSPARSFRSRLAARERLFGTLLTMPSPAVAEMAADAGLDWLFLDMEHGTLDLAAVEAIAQAVGDRCACVVRVPINDRLWIGKVLDLGVAGVILPQVNSAEAARQGVFAAKYPPTGGRGVGVGRAARYGAALTDYLARANDETAVIVQIEHIEAVRNVEAIAAVPGVDALMVGPFDLSASLGQPGQLADPAVVDAIATVRAAGLARGMPLSIFYPDAARALEAARAGFTLLPVATDTLLLGGALRQLRASLES